MVHMLISSWSSQAEELLEQGRISKKNALIFNQDLPSDKSKLSPLNS